MEIPWHVPDVSHFPLSCCSSCERYVLLHGLSPAVCANWLFQNGVAVENANCASVNQNPSVPCNEGAWVWRPSVQWSHGKGTTVRGLIIERWRPWKLRIYFVCGNWKISCFTFQLEFVRLSHVHFGWIQIFGHKGLGSLLPSSGFKQPVSSPIAFHIELVKIPFGSVAHHRVSGCGRNAFSPISSSSWVTEELLFLLLLDCRRRRHYEDPPCNKSEGHKIALNCVVHSAFFCKYLQ